VAAMATVAVFDKYWGRYDEWYSRNRVIALNELRTVRSIGLRGLGLEVGVGTGWFASRLGVGFGVDPSINMLRVAWRRGVEAVQAVGERLPFRSGVFDYVLLIVTLCFVDDPWRVVGESARVLKRGGRLVACIVPRDSPWGRYYEARRETSPFYRVARFYTVGEVESMMTGAGLVVEGHYSTLHFNPGEEPRLEEPRPGASGGFVCIYALKPG